MTICQFKHRPARKWLRISLTCGPEMGEIAAALISELTGTGIEIKTDLITVSSQDIHDLAGPFDLIMANITHDILSELAPTIVFLLSSPGSLIVSGILQGKQEEAIIRTYADHGLELKEKNGQEEWVALLFEPTTHVIW